eukprot:TRINITY_DN82493_c0_g1_i1.p1 TRINITY_DN82493_c0_g1~~TRINITY_DN82493_c0_g1_i1.p1  ORF type:complete len:239 (-),score=36.30 TRINITY_DN82493_c0_g1_i1:26-742(-)
MASSSPSWQAESTQVYAGNGFAVPSFSSVANVFNQNVGYFFTSEAAEPSCGNPPGGYERTPSTASVSAGSASQAGSSLTPPQPPQAPPYATEGFGVFNEQLQEDVFLGGLDLSNELEIKNTFYNVPEYSSMVSDAGARLRWQSAPSVLVEKSWRTKWPQMEAAHNRGECKPCSYFLYKQDGCRNSDNCPYCHLCTKGEIKRRKKKKVKALKAASAAEAAAAAAAASTVAEDSDDDEPR